MCVCVCVCVCVICWAPPTDRSVADACGSACADAAGRLLLVARRFPLRCHSSRLNSGLNIEFPSPPRAYLSIINQRHRLIGQGRVSRSGGAI